MAIAVVSHTSAGPGANGGTTSAIDTTGASFLAVSIDTYGGDPLLANLSDSKGNTWTALTTSFSAVYAHERIFYCENPTVGSGHTFTFSQSLSFPSICVAAFSGVNTASAFDQQNGNTSTSATSLSSGSVTPSENNELVLSAIGFTTSGSRSIDGGFTILDQQDYVSSVTMGGALAYLIQTSAAAANPTWSWSSACDVATRQATFKAAAVASGGTSTFDSSKTLSGITFDGGSIFRC